MLDIKIGGIGNFLKLLWIDIKKFWFKRNFKLVNFGHDNVYQEKNKKSDKKILYCFKCGNSKGEAVPLASVKEYDWDYKCNNCEKTFFIYKGIEIDFRKRKCN